MANELQTDYLTGQTVYFLLRNAVGQVWNGSSFESYQTANYATYPITATEQGSSGYYTANFPSISAGIYYAVAKAQSGGSPAETDFSVGWGNVDWGGSAPAFFASGNVYLASGLIPAFTASGVVQARLADGVVHGGTTATLRLGTSGSTAAFYATNDGGDAVKFEAISGPLNAGHGLSLQGAGTSGGDGLRTMGSPFGDGIHSEGGTASGQVTRGMHVRGGYAGLSLEGGVGAGLYVTAGGNGAYIAGGTGNAGLLVLGGLSGAGADFRGTQAPGFIMRGGTQQPGALFMGGVSGAGAVFQGSGVPDVQGIVVSSGSLSGQQVNLLSGNQVQVWSGTQVNLFSGQLSGVVATPASGAFVVASLLSGQSTSVYSGQLSGQQVNLHSGNQVGVVSGTLFPASGSTQIASGPFVVAQSYSGQMSGQMVNANLVAIDGGGTSGFNAALRLRRLDIVNQSGAEEAVTITAVDGAAIYARGGRGGPALLLRGGNSGTPSVELAQNGPGVRITSELSGPAIEITTIFGHGIQITAEGPGQHGVYATSEYGDGMRLVGGLSGVDLQANILGNVSGEVYPVSGRVWLASGSVALSGQASLLSGSVADVAQAVLRYNVSGIASGTIPVVSLGSVALKLASRFNARSGTTYLPDGTSVHMTQTPVNGSGMAPIGELGVGQQ